MPSAVHASPGWPAADGQDPDRLSGAGPQYPDGFHTTDPPSVDEVAAALVTSGRVVPGLARDPDTQSWRSWWWPLPSASQKALVASVVEDRSIEGQRRAASRLAEAVDGLVRRRLVSAGASTVARRPGRPTVPEAWARSLVAPEPWLPASLDGDKVAALAGAVGEWVRSGAVVGGRSRLCLRVHEPGAADRNPGAEPAGTAAPSAGDTWVVELLAQDADEPSLVVGLAEVWAGESPLPPSAFEEILAALGRMARLAPEMAHALEVAVPDVVEVDDRAVVTLLRDRAAVLEDAGIAVLLPSWWSRPARLGLRAKAKSSSSGGSAAGAKSKLGMDALVDFEWQAALGDQKLSKADLLRLQKAADAKRSLVRLRGQWVEVDPARVAEMLARAGITGQASARELLVAGLGLGRLDLPQEAGLDVVGVDASAVGWLRSLLDGALHATVEPLSTPVGFEGSLRPYQERGAGWLAFLGDLGMGACLADDMGLGKTAQLIAALLAQRESEAPTAPALVVSPVSVLGNWQRELGRFAPSLNVLVHHGPERDLAHLVATPDVIGPDPDGPAAARSAAGRSAAGRGSALPSRPTKGAPPAGPSLPDVVLTTYSLLARDVEELAAVAWSAVVFDEAQQLKNPGTAQTRAARRLTVHPAAEPAAAHPTAEPAAHPAAPPAAPPRRIALTGTPVENRLSELWSIMNVLNPGLLGSAREFKARFAGPIEREADPEATDLLRRVTGPFVLRRLKTDRSIIADLPDKIETVDRCPLTPEQASLYQAVVDELLQASDELDGMQRRGVVLAGLSRLKQVCNHPAHFLSDGSSLTGRSGKLTRAEELLEEILAEGDKVLCFTQFAEWGGMLAPYLARRTGAEVLWLHGATRRRARDEMVERFSEPEGPPIFLISLKAGGTGLNLTAASHVIHLDRWWNPAVEDQATDRAYRIGQRRNVQVHKLVSSGTIEERIDEMITAKRDLAARVVGTGEGWLSELSTADLRSLVELSSQAVAV